MSTRNNSKPRDSPATYSCNIGENWRSCSLSDGLSCFLDALHLGQHGAVLLVDPEHNKMLGLARYRSLRSLCTTTVGRITGLQVCKRSKWLDAGFSATEGFYSRSKSCACSSNLHLHVESLCLPLACAVLLCHMAVTPPHKITQPETVQYSLPQSMRKKEILLK